MSRVYAFFDTETGGLTVSEDILTFWMGMFDEDFKLLEELDLKLKPNDGRWPVANEGALKVNGINLEAHMADISTVPYSEGNKKLSEMLKRHLKKRGRFSNLIPAGHNVDFDIRFINAHLMGEAEWNSLMHYSKVDTKVEGDFLKRCGWLPPDLGTLISYADYFQVPKRKAHSAKEDTLMCVDVCVKMTNLLKDRKNSNINYDLISLLEQE